MIKIGSLSEVNYVMGIFYSFLAILVGGIGVGIFCYIIGDIYIFFGLFIGAFLAHAFVFGSENVDIQVYVIISFIAVLGGLFVDYITLMLFLVLDYQMPLNFDNLMFVISAVEFLYNDEPYNLLYFIFVVVGAFGTTKKLDEDRQSTIISENEKNNIFQQQMNRQAGRYE